MFTPSLSHVCSTQRRIRRVNGKISTCFGGKLVLEGISKLIKTRAAEEHFISVLNYLQKSE